MTKRSWVVRIGAAVIALACGASFGARVAAQAAKPPAGPAAGEIETDPIKCWWKTDRSSVHVGDRFTITLTCGVIETSTIKVVPDLSTLEPTTLQVAPFEVVRGVKHQDVPSPPWRYFQNEYTVRMLSDAYFGKDVDIPQVKVGYHIQSSIGGGSEGREQTYLLPALPMRVESVVPKRASDIRDASRESFADVEARRYRSNAELVAAIICFAFTLVLLALAAVRVGGRYRARVPAAARLLPAGRVLGGCLRALARTKSAVARDGWTPALAGQALAALRVATAIAQARQVAQVVVDAREEGREGQLALGKGLLRRRRVLVSAAATPDPSTKPLSGYAPSAHTQAIVEELKDSMRVCNTARYGRDVRLDTAALDAALESAVGAIRRLRLAKLWPVRTAGALKRSAADLGGMVWSR